VTSRINLYALAVGPTWTDKGTLGVLVAQLFLLAIGGYVAWLQLREQVRPFVVIDLDDRYPPHLQFIITNIGKTLARDVRFKFEPPLQSTRDTEPVEGRVGLASVSLFRDGIPSFPPGKKFVVLFDNEIERRKAPLTDRLEVEISYEGRPFGRQFTDRFVLNIETYRWWGQIRRKDVHDVANEIEKLRKAIEAK
jgi:hypothetical protein